MRVIKKILPALVSYTINIYDELQPFAVLSASTSLQTFFCEKRISEKATDMYRHFNARERIKEINYFEMLEREVYHTRFEDTMPKGYPTSCFNRTIVSAKAKS